MISRTISLLESADAVLCRVCLWRRPRAFILDKLFGPAQNFDFTGSTTPTTE